MHRAVLGDKVVNTEIKIGKMHFPCSIPGKKGIMCNGEILLIYRNKQTERMKQTKYANDVEL